MFDKTKARLRKFEETHNNVHAAAEHVRNNQTGYLIGATGVSCLLVGGLGGAALGKVDVKQTVDSFKIIHFQWKSPNINIALNRPEMPPPQPVLDKTTGIPYPSMRKAAALTTLAYEAVRKDANGPQLRFEKLPESVFA